MSTSFCTNHPAPSGLTQCDAILFRLQLTPGEWVPMPALSKLSGSYVIHSRIADLRRRGHRIDQRNLRLGKQCHSEYRLAEAAYPPGDPAMPCANCGQPMIRVRASDFDGWSCMSTPCCVYRVAASSLLSSVSESSVSIP